MRGYVTKAERGCTALEQDVLVNLMEECAEVTQMCSKILRFGPGDLHPVSGRSNLEHLGEEVGNALHCIDEAKALKLVPAGSVAKGRKEKKEKMPYYSQAMG